MSYNKVVLLGRLTADPVRRVTQSGVEASVFTVAINRPKGKDGQSRADFPKCVAWRSVAEFVNKYFSKGKPILIEGRLETRTYEDQQKGTVWLTEVIVSAASFVEGEKAREATLPAPPSAEASVEAPTAIGPALDFAEVDADGDLPF